MLAYKCETCGGHLHKVEVINAGRTPDCSCALRIAALEKQVADMDKAGRAMSQVMLELEKERDDAREDRRREL